MNETNIQQNEELEIDPMRLMKAVWKKAWLVAGTSLMGAILAFVITVCFITPQYQSSVLFYVNNNSMSLGDAALSITSSDISASRGLVDSYIIILKARETLLDVIDYAGVERDDTELSGMLSAEAINNTEIFRVVATSPDPQEAEKIASAVAYILPKRISGIIEGTSAKIVDSAIVAAKPSSPSYRVNMLVGFLTGFIFSVGAIVLWVILDITIRTEADITQNCKYPVLAAIPDMEAPGKGDYDDHYHRDRKKHPINNGKNAALVGSDIHYAAAEAYRLLRTKVQFSFADESSSRVIGISSALCNEGKSVSAINLAYSLSQLGKKVILIDCDMRRPTLAEKLKIQKKPGLSNFLTGQTELKALLQSCGIRNDETAFRVIAAGPDPPNPVELLSSGRMKKMLIGLRNVFDYIILDLPPVSEVSDALAVAKQTDGMLLVVRQDHCNRVVLKETIQQFAFVDTKMLGIIFNCTTEEGGGYGYKKYGKRYAGKSRPNHAGGFFPAERGGEKKRIKK